MKITKIIKPGKEVFDRAFAGQEAAALSSAGYLRMKTIKKFAGNPDSTVYLAENNRKAAGFVILNYLGWDSDIFKFKVGRLEIFFNAAGSFAKEELLKYIIKDCKRRHYKQLSCRILLNDLSTLHLLEGLKFNLADIQITLCTPDGFKDREFGSGLDPALIRKATDGDLKELRELAKDAFTDTRFANDSRFSRDGVNRLYYEWIRNSLANPAQAVFVSLDEASGALTGFCVLNIDRQIKEFLGYFVGSIDLIAVNKNYRGRGFGKALTRHALSWFKDKVDRVEVRTQVSNIAAISAFRNSGFDKFCAGEMLPAGITMHGWF